MRSSTLTLLLLNLTTSALTAEPPPPQPPLAAQDILAQFPMLEISQYRRHASVRRDKKIRYIQEDDYVSTAKKLVETVAPGLTLRLVPDHYIGTDGFGHVRFKQTIKGLDIDNADFNVNVDPNNRVFSYGHSLYRGPPPPPSSPLQKRSLSDPVRALTGISQRLRLGVGYGGARAVQAPGTQHFVFEGTSGCVSKPQAQLAYLQKRGGELKLAWRIETDLRRKWLLSYVDAGDARTVHGIVNYAADAAAESTSTTNSNTDTDIDTDTNANDYNDGYDPAAASFKVYPWGVSDPTQGERTVVKDPWSDEASPFTWLGDGNRTYQTLRGNNAVAHVDLRVLTFPGLDDSKKDQAKGQQGKVKGQDDDAQDQNDSQDQDDAQEQNDTQAQDDAQDQNQDDTSAQDGAQEQNQDDSQDDAQDQPESTMQSKRQSQFPCTRPFDPDPDAIDDISLESPCLYRPTSQSLQFSYPYSPLQPNPSTYRDASITQLFYTANKYHDLLYALGFVERAGNFQEDNYGRGGVGGDFVVLNAQDNEGFNNAYFVAPPDGQRGFMAMFLWTLSRPVRDGAFDTIIVLHEYTHGLSVRLTGGPSNSACLSGLKSGGMGEGWSDIMAAASLLNTTYTRRSNFALSPWAANRTNGIREFPYSTDTKTNPLTYADVNNMFEVHSVGTVWATILYEVIWNLIDKHGITDDDMPQFDYDGVPTDGRYLAMKLIMDGLAMQPCSPNFLLARDAILDADEALTGGKNRDLLWKGFAKRGLGFKAKYDPRKRKNDFSVPKKRKYPRGKPGRG